MNEIRFLLAIPLAMHLAVLRLLITRSKNKHQLL